MTRHLFLCNGIKGSPLRRSRGDAEPVRLDYRNDERVRLALPHFLRSVLHVPPRLLDLLEIAAYVFAADRLVDRGNPDAIEFSGWSRDMRFAIRVRDARFWEREDTRQLLSEVLCFVSGDRSYEFAFIPGHQTPPEGLFDREDFVYEPDKPHHIVLFSGGLDSLTGAVERLANTAETVCLVSHRSSLPSTARTQDRLYQSLQKRYPGRVLHYRCASHLTGSRAISEAQRTRTFLYGSIAFALARALNQPAIYFYENGVTSLNFQRRQDLLNARASRTTHPHTLQLLQRLFAHVSGKDFQVNNPFAWDTKADVLTRLANAGSADLLSSSVSCSKTFRTSGEHTHCGGCFQCIDRRLAVYAAGLTPFDNEQLYAFDIATKPIMDPDIRTATIDYVRAGVDFAKSGLDRFFTERTTELALASDPNVDERQFVERVWGLMKRFGEQTLHALKTLQREKDDLGASPIKDSLLTLIADREYLREDAERLARRIAQRMRVAVPKMFRQRPPQDEVDFNNKLNGLVEHDREDYRREFPTTTFAAVRVIPDHELVAAQLLIEAKFVRGGTTGSKVSDAIAADLIKYPRSSFLLFLVYDPHRGIADDRVFSLDLERGRQRTKVILLR